MKELREILRYENLYNPYTRVQEALYESLLHSYSPYKLIQTLEKKFGNHIIKYSRPNPSEYDKLCVAVFACTPENEKMLKSNKDFQSILNLFNYTFTYSYPTEKNGHEIKVCVLEPNITGDYTKIVYDDWGGVVYHVTEHRYLKSILENGLRIRKGQIYRKYDERIFVTGGDDWRKNISILIDDLGLRYRNYVVLKINLKNNHHKIRFFRDPMQTSCLGLYTRENINPECIEEYPFEDTL